MPRSVVPPPQLHPDSIGDLLSAQLEMFDSTRDLLSAQLEMFLPPHMFVCSLIHSFMGVLVVSLLSKGSLCKGD